MRLSSRFVKLPLAWGIGLLSMAVLVGCSGAPTGLSSDEMATQELDVAASAESAPAEITNGDRSTPIPPNTFQSSTKLIKHATLQLKIDDMDVAIAAVSDILTQYQGDLLQLADTDSQNQDYRQMSLQLRVPQTHLEAALEALRNLGSVETQSISAEDVSTQLVDLQARVRNMRKSEESLLAIMERSGSITEVLEVSRELSTVREAIERHEAQLKNLQDRVAYSTISLTLISRQALESPSDPVGETLGQTWQTASSSMRALSVALLQLSLWLLVFSPYLGILVLSGWAGRRYWQRQRSPKTPAN